MRYLIKESLYKEIMPVANGITQKYLDFHKEYSERKQKMLDEFQQELEEKEAHILKDLKELNDKYVQTIYECLVDVEDLYKNCIPPDVDRGLRSYYVAQVSDYPRFVDVQQKINDIIGESAFNLEFKIGNDNSHRAVRYATKEFTNGDNVKTIEEFEQVIKGVDASDRMTVRFVFKPVTDWKPIRQVEYNPRYDDEDYDGEEEIEFE